VVKTKFVWVDIGFIRDIRGENSRLPAEASGEGGPIRGQKGSK
jgi:hypothetical protein